MSKRLNISGPLHSAPAHSCPPIQTSFLHSLEPRRCRLIQRVVWYNLVYDWEKTNLHSTSLRSRKTDTYFVLLEGSYLVFQVLEDPVLFTEDAQFDLWARTGWREPGMVRKGAGPAVLSESLWLWNHPNSAWSCPPRVWGQQAAEGSACHSGHSRQYRSQQSSLASGFDLWEGPGLSSGRWTI